MSDACPFCNDPAIEERTIVRNKYVRAFPTNIPIVPMHVLVIPARHVGTIGELSNEEKNALFEMIERLCELFRASFGAEGFNVAWNEGVVAGQSVPHMHVHLLPRKQGDTGITGYEPRTFLYRPGSREDTPENELQDVAKTIRKALEE
jgi:diadenosine tetraphosphate (Ap4A) HIT family hydrolase